MVAGDWAAAARWKSWWRTREARRWLFGVGLPLLGTALIVVRPPGWRGWNHWVAIHRGEKAHLAGVDLSAANLTKVNLRSADLRRASLKRAQCFDTDLRHADLRGADLRDALLAGADLRGARLEETRLTGAVYDRTTRWPTSYHPLKHGAVPGNWDARVWAAFGRPER
jgi:sirohydrochlorin ferrochelatase